MQETQPRHRRGQGDRGRGRTAADLVSRVVRGGEVAAQVAEVGVDVFVPRGRRVERLPTLDVRHGGVQVAVGVVGRPAAVVAVVKLLVRVVAHQVLQTLVNLLLFGPGSRGSVGGRKPVQFGQQADPLALGELGQRVDDASEVREVVEHGWLEELRVFEPERVLARAQENADVFEAQTPGHLRPLVDLLDVHRRRVQGGEDVAQNDAISKRVDQVLDVGQRVFRRKHLELAKPISASFPQQFIHYLLPFSLTLDCRRHFFVVVGMQIFFLGIGSTTATENKRDCDRCVVVVSRVSTFYHSGHLKNGSTMTQVPWKTK